MENLQLTINSLDQITAYRDENHLVKYEPGILNEMINAVESRDEDTLQWFNSFGDSLRAVIMNVYAYRKGLEFGFTDIKFDQYGWLISMIFVTHSPFILSDIPDQQVMFLKVDNGKAAQVIRDRKTFGANIHNLLSDGFFMEDGFCGAFAIDKINEIIAYLNIQKKHDQLVFLQSNKNHKVTQDEDNQLKDYEKKLIKYTPAEIKGIIELIGENVIANKLLEMYDELYQTTPKDRISKEIKRLQDLLAKHK
ncbi:hypothetical protein [Mucilaginibacter aquariorum]|uniref:Uncharacterized protein n=1 Tax=Mucilaginibacter aquariorum TaxID=2967225 RepID=A0ABT1SXK7_9SPHI|nr:hypothetical protein [Mucilaginibacter aquariorum]MCQ6957085.1 hypothetical protein [Mucilaginibacter aquariorum]